MTKNKQESLGDKIKKVYRMNVVDINDLREVKSFSISIRNVLALAVLAVFLILLLYTLFVAYTPVKRLIPGYGDIEENTKFIELRNQLLSLEEEVESQRVYNEGLRKILQGEEMDEEWKELPENIEEIKESRKNEVISSSHIKEASLTEELDNVYFVNPVYGSVSAPFDVTIDHYGTDILAPADTPIMAVARGVVLFSDWTVESGNTIAIQHPHNIVTIYKHNSTILKQNGDFVNAGEAIAVIGNTGTLSSGPHLHFELWYNGIPVDPENYFTF